MQATVDNGLFYSISNVAYGGSGFKFLGRNITVHQCAALTGDPYENGTLVLTNSLLVHMTNWGDTSMRTTNLVVVTTNTVFQTVGAGSHYLATNSAYRNIGTTNVPAELLADLRKATTYPPIVLGPANPYTNNLDLTPQAQRDTDSIDLGYHYYPLDYVIGGLNLTNATLTASNGVALGTRSVDSFGIGIGTAAHFYSEGTPDRPNQIVRYNLVQEQATTNWATSAAELRVLTALPSSGAPSYVSARFTHWSTHAAGGENFYTYGANDTGSHSIRDSEFHNGDIWCYRPTIALTNCLLNRSGLNILDDAETISPSVRNCTVRGGSHNFAQANGGTWIFHNNLFDDATIATQDATVTHSYNGYTTNATRLTPTQSTDIKLSVTNISYQVGTLGRFYLPTNLTSHNPLRNTTGTVGSYSGGSTNANYLTLYHFTCTTNQVKETNTVVDLGYHYVATDANGLPLDYDTDGWPDYWEDLNGNGSLDSGESNWQSAGDQGFRVWITKPKNGNNVP